MSSGSAGRVARTTPRPCDGARGTTNAGTAVRTFLRTADGVRIDCLYEPGQTPVPGLPGPAADDRADGPDGTRTGGPEDAPAFVVAHGFTGDVDRPHLRRVARALRRHGAVLTFSFRGHGASGGRSTVGDREVLDLAAAVGRARELGHARVVTVGFSMGGSVVLRHAALGAGTGGAAAGGPGAGGAGTGGDGAPAGPAEPSGPSEPSGLAGLPALPERQARPDAVVSVSAPARWFYRGTAPMRRLHWLVTRPEGRLVGRYGLRTRIHHRQWDPVPLSPVQSVPRIAPTPLLIVHGDRDGYFPLDHPRMLAAAAGDQGELWIEPGMGHAENAVTEALLHRIGDWAVTRAG
ncbi:alpha/beta hydrolase [Streptomyces sp. NPDC029526]|uniref:alpha/beta hydrolase n=1 Tax=Streptomyces sp. NPDC029526 TaxID=3155728 RepID=UPI0033EE5FAE